ncbi:unnamed protein product [Acanthoscelides obtectus]|uniref:Uncharacterized protein n=1 Tax=Acanthoscelides obtectus TaxID=200917 RepID=A0A9P0QII1_ACAOB|nr:unnamed protein product [Acanthoscelides obtectus]CAK1684253.1 hypothetical protein AOBTE_LOCUS34748 [Acanthoscelides obtectus]
MSVSQGGLPPGKKRKESKDSMDAIIEDNSQKVILCHNCMRYGHLGQCRSKPRCAKCHEEHVTSSCHNDSLEQKCLICDGSHYSFETSNNEFERQKVIKKHMAMTNSSFRDSNNAVPKTTYASVTKNNPITPQEINSSNLPSQSSNTQTSINIPNANSHFTQRLFETELAFLVRFDRRS